MLPRNRTLKPAVNEAHEVLLARALRLREGIIQAVAWKRPAALCHLARSLLSLSPSVGVLKASGLGKLLHDKQVWAATDNQTKVLLSRVECKWKAFIKTEIGKACPAGTSEPAPPFGGRKPQDFVKVVDDLTEWLTEVDEIGVVTRVARKLSVALALRDVSHWSHLEGWDADALDECSLCAASAALWKRALDKATRTNASRRLAAVARQTRLPALPDPQSEGTSAAVEASRLHVMVHQDTVDVVTHLSDGKVVRAGLPQDVIRQLGAARDQGVDVGERLLQQAAALRVETQRQSLRSVASGLRAWHQFAVLVLGYAPNLTLPPAAGEDVEQFITIFRNGATASNYVGYVKWVCMHLHLNLDWSTPAVAATLKGSRKRSLRQRGGILADNKLLTQKMVHSMISLADLQGDQEFATAALVNFEFMLRVQSEGLQIQAGQAEEAVVLSPERHSGLWIVQKQVVCLRLMRRKHRPQGSLLKRACTCATVGPQFCTVHRCLSCLAGKVVGSRLWYITPSTFLAKTRRYLGLLGVANARTFTLKAYRAGKATSMASAGATVGQILMAGEWRSHAFLRYVDTDVVDAAQLLSAVVEGSDCE